MTKTELREKVDTVKRETRDALQTVYDALNHGQQQKLLKDEGVKVLFDRYGVVYGGDGS